MRSTISFQLLRSCSILLRIAHWSAVSCQINLRRLSIKTLLLVGLKVIYVGDGFGQNLIPNQGFEYCRIPINDWMLTDAQFNECMINWFSPNSGSPDILQKDELKRMRHIRPNVNIQSYSPRSGKVMVGLKLFGCEDGDHCKEYIQIRLRERLQIGTQYYFEAWAKPINSSVKINNIGVLFSTSEISKTGAGIYDYQPQVNTDGIVIDTSGAAWIKISDTICVDSSYQFLTLGNFFLDNQTMSIVEQNGINYAYYLFDDLSLESIERNCAGAPINTIINTRNIHFETDKSDLKTESFSELNKLVSFLKDHMEKQIEIQGHTDNVGTVAYNQRLSLDRANSVLEYLVAQGISRERLLSVGKGSSQPLLRNTSEESRRINRRVEILFTN